MVGSPEVRGQPRQCLLRLTLLRDATSTSCGSRSPRPSARSTHDDVPVGAVLVPDGEVIGAGHNERELRQDPSAHAEMLAIREAAARARLLAAARHDALRDARAVRDVRGRDRARPHPARRLRHRRPEGGRRRARSSTSSPSRASTTARRSPAACSPTSAPTLLRDFFALAPLTLIATLRESHARRGARVVESGGLENRCVGNPCTEGSNPSPSASEFRLRELGVRRHQHRSRRRLSCRGDSRAAFRPTAVAATPTSARDPAALRRLGYA